MEDPQERSGKPLHLVTGAFGYSGSYIGRALLDAGYALRTLTSRSGAGHALEGRVEVFPLDFGDPAGLRRALEGVRVLYNTYWVRFTKAGFSQTEAVRNTRLLFECARDAGVERIVHVSVANPSLDSPYEYFRGKAQLEQALMQLGVPCSILRPAVLFGGDDILINNIAWSLRRLPIFGIFGDGRYKLQPIHVEDFARLAVLAGVADGKQVVQAVGHETYAYRDLVAALAKAMGIRRPLISMPTACGLLGAKLIGAACRDVTLTREEVGALMDDLLVTDSLPETGQDAAVRIRLSEWMEEQADVLGRRYANELARRKPGR